MRITNVKAEAEADAHSFSLASAAILINWFKSLLLLQAWEWCLQKKPWKLA